MKQEKIYDVIVVGAGTAGLSAAIYGLRAGKKLLVLEEKNYGGQIIVTPEIENYPGISKISGYEFAQSLYQQAQALGMEYETGRVTQIIPGQDKTFLIKTTKGSGEGKEYTARSVILATGAKNRPLDIDREEEFVGQGISYCATCDGRFYKNRQVAVVGGGNTALEDALFLSEYCSKVYLVHRREEFRGEMSKLELLRQKDNVEILCNCIVTAIAGDDEIPMKGVLVWNRKSKQELLLPAAGLFIAVGQMPDNEVFAELAGLDEQGYIKAGEDCKTKTPGIFAAGDCRTKKVRQLTTAASDGAVAALMACEYTSGM
jgi:thioredoxin reductase (NADPH)